MLFFSDRNLRSQDKINKDMGKRDGDDDIKTDSPQWRHQQTRL